MLKNKLICVNIFLCCAIVLPLTACGFKLRGQQTNLSDIKIQKWYIKGTISDNLRKHINKQMLIRQAHVEDDIKNTVAILDIQENYFEQTNNISKGRISDIRLKYNISFLVRQTQQDKILLIPQSIEQFRDITVSDNNALAQDQKKKDLMQEMQYHAAGRILELIQQIK
jgi:outer membrane lipopolysaccharide assembly protein LptE/RlpB